MLALTDQHTDVVGEFTGTALAGSATYDPLGNVTASTNMAGNLGYQSGWTDHATGRVNMAARWYNPATGQFDNRDSIGVSPLPNPMAANRYAYADDNPLTNTDPTGHCAINDDGDLCVGHRVVGGLPQTGPITTPTHNTLRCTDGDCRVNPAPRAVTGTTPRTNPNHPNDAAPRSAYSYGCFKACPSRPLTSAERREQNHNTADFASWIPFVDIFALNWQRDMYEAEGNDKAADQIDQVIGTDIALGDGAVPAGFLLLGKRALIKKAIKEAAEEEAERATARKLAQAAERKAAQEEERLEEEEQRFLNWARNKNHGNSPTGDTPPSGGRSTGGQTPHSGSDIGSGGTGGSGGAPDASNAPARTTAIRHEPATVAAAPKNNAAAARPALGYDGNEPIYFGQARVSPGFSAGGNFHGASVDNVAADLTSGRISPNDVEISAFRHSSGVLVTENNRSLTVLSMVGLRPTNVRIIDPRQDVLNRLIEEGPLGDTLPSSRIAITPSQSDWTILNIVQIPLPGMGMG